MDARPMTATTAPPMNIKTGLSVGDPVKKLDTSDLKEYVALTPMRMSAAPQTSRARETILLIISL
jgi:hypothetical protein